MSKVNRKDVQLIRNADIKLEVIEGTPNSARTLHMNVNDGQASHTLKPTSRYVQALDSMPVDAIQDRLSGCLLYTSPSPRDGLLPRMPSSA